MWVGFLPGLPESQAGESQGLALLSLKEEWPKQKVEADPLRTYREDHTLGRDETQGCIPCPALRGKMRERTEEGKKEGEEEAEEEGTTLGDDKASWSAQEVELRPASPSTAGLCSLLVSPHLSGCENMRP